MKRTAGFLILGCFLASFSSADPAQQYVKQFEKIYRKAVTLRATFLETYFENGEAVRSEAGVAYFRRPGKMRWEYNSPEKNLFLVDGKTAWFYVPEDHTVTKMPAKRSEDWRTPLALLAGEAKVSRICSKVEEHASEQPADKSLVLLDCGLRGSEKRSQQSSEEALSPDTTPAAVQFELVRATGELRRVIIHERGNSIVEFRFAQWEFNPPIPESSFQFHPPMGVAIVDGELGSAGGGQEKQ
ncbi:MAG TPA: outer membrane lipoprotein carrier protein LolA [Terriglobales bacterium]|nr:outer membrane lipoprotein carrier protein LolA [Terriglobales bacterium]